jgi:hypothetical protein
MQLPWPKLLNYLFDCYLDAGTTFNPAMLHWLRLCGKKGTENANLQTTQTRTTAAPLKLAGCETEVKRFFAP